MSRADQGTTDLRAGLVVASHGRHCLVETANGERLICHPRGKKTQAVVGDRVRWQPPADGQGDEGIVETIDARRNLFYRQDELRTKSFAANLDRVLILVAADPEFSESQLSRALIAAQAEQIVPLIVLNKRDLRVPFERAWDRLGAYREMGYTVLPLELQSAENNVPPQAGQRPAADLLADLVQQLKGHATLVLGPSGSGKSSLINRMVAGAKALTGEVSRALNSGKHTTTSTTWYWTDDMSPSDNLSNAGTAPYKRSALIDSPGFQEFGLHHIKPMQLPLLMPDFKPWTADCRFYNCTHRKEPGCAILSRVDTASDAGGISAARYKIYTDLFAELSLVRY